MASLTDAQLITFDADIQANTDQIVVDALAAGQNNKIADFYSADSDNTIWRDLIEPEEVGLGFNGEEFDGLTTANTNRLTAWFASLPTGFIANREDHRDLFDGVFSGAGGQLTRANLAIIWRRLANELEKLFAITGSTPTGDGTNALPKTLVVNGVCTVQNVRDALAS